MLQEKEKAASGAAAARTGHSVLLTAQGLGGPFLFLLQSCVCPLNPWAVVLQAWNVVFPPLLSPPGKWAVQIPQFSSQRFALIPSLSFFCVWKLKATMTFISHLVLKLGLPASSSSELPIPNQPTRRNCKKAGFLGRRPTEVRGASQVLTSLSQTCVFLRYTGLLPLLRDGPPGRCLTYPTVPSQGPLAVLALGTKQESLAFQHQSRLLPPLKAQLIYFFKLAFFLL